MISDDNFPAENQAASALDDINQIAYAPLRGVLDMFVEAPGPASSGFQNFI
ncbi:hypothetical protein [Herbidospora sp. RD11066]